MKSRQMRGRCPLMKYVSARIPASQPAPNNCMSTPGSAKGGRRRKGKQRLSTESGLGTPQRDRASPATTRDSPRPPAVTRGPLVVSCRAKPARHATSLACSLGMAAATLTEHGMAPADPVLCAPWDETAAGGQPGWDAAFLVPVAGMERSKATAHSDLIRRFRQVSDAADGARPSFPLRVLRCPTSLVRLCSRAVLRVPSARPSGPEGAIVESLVEAAARRRRCVVEGSCVAARVGGRLVVAAVRCCTPHVAPEAYAVPGRPQPLPVPVYVLDHATRVLVEWGDVGGREAEAEAEARTWAEETKKADAEARPAPAARPGWDQVAGLDVQLAAVRATVEMPLHHPELFQQLGVAPPRGALLFGPPGTGKTLIARTLASEAGASFFVVNGAEVLGEYVGESEERLRAVFESAARAEPAIVFIDEIDALCPSRERATEEVQRRVVATLLTLMDGLGARARVAVLAATNRPDALDPALRRPGRFDREIEIGVPSQPGRLSILSSMLRDLPHALADEQLAAAAARTHGFVGADLRQLCREAALAALRRAGVGEGRGGFDHDGDAGDGGSSTTTAVGDDHLRIEWRDVEEALNRVRPSSLRESAVEVPEVRWSDIGGQEEIKQQLREAVEWPLQHPEAFRRMGIRPPRGVLLYGPPGCSKTLLAKALATESEMNFLAVKGPELLSKWVGDSEKAVQQLFARARRASPSVIFFDEIDALASARGGGGEGGGGGSAVSDRVLSQLLQEMDGVQARADVVVVAATNRPDLLDPALLRPGRLDRLLMVGLPDPDSRLAVLRIHCRGVPLDPEVHMPQLVERTKGYTGAELAAVCREASMAALEEDMGAQRVGARHFAAALARVRPQVTSAMLAFYRSFSAGSAKGV